MKKILLRALIASLFFPAAASGDPATRERLLRHFGDWYPFYPGTRVSVRETEEVSVPGLEAYRVQRHTDSKRHQEANIALYDREKDEVFVGRVLHDSARAAAGRAFDPLVDLPEIEKQLSGSYGVSASVAAKGARGALREISIKLQQLSDAWLSLPGYVSEDGASILLGEFQSLADGPRAFRRRLLAENAGVRLGTGQFFISEFLDFQCERCRRRAPEVKKFVGEKRGAVEIRFFPLVKVHPWAFAAAESAAALAAISPDLFEKYEAVVFARAETMTAEAARQLAGDVAEAANRKKELTAQLSSGRPRERVLADLRLGMRLGVTGTPYFIHDGTLVSAEPDLLETLLRERLGERPVPPSS